MNKYLPVFLLQFICLIPLQAQTGLVMEPVVVTASRIPNSLNNAISNVTVISRDQIEARQSANVLELLRNEAGLQVNQATGRGSTGSIMIRNSEANYVLVLIDGVKVNDTTNDRGGSYDLSRLSTDFIERIEIVKGALSSVYGSAALGGVINIISKKSDSRHRSSVKLNTGSGPAYKAVGQYQQNSGPLSYSLSISYDHDKADEYNTFTGHNRNLSSTWKNKSSTINFSAQHQKSKSSGFPYQSGGEKYAVLRELETKNINEKSFSLGYSGKVSAWQHQVNANWGRHDEKVYFPGIDSVTGFIDSDSQLDRLQTSISSRLKLPSETSVLLGADYESETGASEARQDVPFVGVIQHRYKEKRYNQSLFSEVQTELAGLQLKAGMRYDQPRNQEEELSSNLGVGFGKNLKLILNYGTAYKVPSFYALYHPLVGNTDLLNEKSAYAEIRLQHQAAGPISWDISAFRYEYENLVDFDTSIFKMVNRKSVSSRGAELSLRYHTKQGQNIKAHLSYNDTVNDANGNELLLRPRKRAGLEYFRSLSKTLQFNLSLYHVGARKDFSYATGDVELSAYNNLDLDLHWSVLPELTIRASLDNLFDKAYEETVGNESRGSLFMLSVQGDMK